MESETIRQQQTERYVVRRCQGPRWDLEMKQTSASTPWGVWEAGSDPASDEPLDWFEQEEEAKRTAAQKAEKDEQREAEERRITEEEAEDDCKAAALAAQGITILRHNPKVERLCKMIVKGDGVINFNRRKRALEIAKQLLTPVQPKPADDDDALIAQYDPDSANPKGKPTYKIVLSVTGSRLEATMKKAKVVFGSLLLKVEKVAKSQSRADELAEAVEMVSDARSIVENLKDEIDQWHENLPDSFRDGDKGSQLEECMEALDQLISSLEDAESNADSVEFPSMY